MANTVVEKLGNTAVQPSTEEILAEWKKRVDAYQYDPNRPVRHYPLEHFAQALKKAVHEKL